MKDKRFIVTKSEGSMFYLKRRILVDRKTGVNYLFVNEGSAAGLTVLLDRDGKPVITPAAELIDK